MSEETLLILRGGGGMERSPSVGFKTYNVVFYPVVIVVKSVGSNSLIISHPFQAQEGVLN